LTITAVCSKGDNKKLSYIISLVLVCAVPMMYVMPWLAKLVLPALLGRHAARDPEGEVPDEEDDDKGLCERIDARMEDFAEEDRRSRGRRCLFLI